MVHDSIEYSSKLYIMETYNSIFNIAIAGAGPAGLTLARLLLQSSISSLINVKVFEKDASSTSRHSIGGTLDLHPSTGLAAIREMDLWDDFLKHGRFDGEEMRVCDRHGTMYLHLKDAPQIKGFEARPEIDRVKLMDILLASVPMDTVKWGKQVKEVIGMSSINYLKFEDNSIEGPFDLIVGADGAWSKIRKVLTDIEPVYSGICSISSTITQESAVDRWDGISAMIGQGSNFSFSDGESMTAQRMGDGSIRCGFGLQRSQDWLENLKAEHGHDSYALKKVLREQFENWIPEFTQWIDASIDLWCSCFWELPVGHRFEHKSGLTLIADAAHLMTPFAGEGVNAAMKDALDLSSALETALQENRGEVDAFVRRFELSMFKRAEQFTQMTMINKKGMFAPDAPYSFLVNMGGLVAKEAGWDLDRGILYWFPVRKLAYTVFWSMGTFGALRRWCVNLL